MSPHIATFTVILAVVLGLSAPSLDAQAPDLSANGITGPASATCGTPFMVTRDITNIGGPLPGIFGYEIRLSTNTIISGSDPLISTFNSNTFGSLSVSVTIPESVPAGFYFLGLIVNTAPGEVVTANNVVAGTVVQVFDNGPVDFQANGITGPAAAAAGQTISVTRDIGNLGCPTSSVFSYQIRASTNATISTSDPLLLAIGSTTLGSLAVNVTIPLSLPQGIYFLGLIVDPGFGETNSSNNAIASLNTISITTNAPTIQSVSPNVGPAFGGTLVTITGTNFVAPLSVTFGGAPASAVNILSPFALTCLTPAATNLMPGAVQVEVTNADGSAALPAGYTYDMPFQGSGEDIVLLTGVNGPPDAIPVKTASPGDIINVAFSSPLATFDGVPVVLAGQVYATGGPGPVTPVLFPELHLDPQNVVVILDGTVASPFGPIVYQPGGITLPFGYQGGLSGFTSRVQAFAVTPSATNGFFAVSDAKEIVFP